MRGGCRRSSPHSGPRAVAGWLMAGLVLLCLALGLTVVAAGEGTVPGDTAIARALQLPVSPEIDAIARFASMVGDDFPSMVILALIGVALLAYLERRDLALFLGIAAAMRAIGPVLKILVASPRPTIEAVVVVTEAGGLGFPSGHAMGAALFYGAIAVIAPQVVANCFVVRAIQVAAVAMMILIALSRVRLGVHWPTDIAGGLLYGLAIVCLLQAAMVTWRTSQLKK